MHATLPQTETRKLDSSTTLANYSATAGPVTPKNRQPRVPGLNNPEVACNVGALIIGIGFGYVILYACVYIYIYIYVCMYIYLIYIAGNLKHSIGNY